MTTVGRVGSRQSATFGPRAAAILGFALLVAASPVAVGADECLNVQIAVDPQSNFVWGYEWPQPGQVIVEIDDPATAVAPDWQGSTMTAPGHAGANVTFDMDAEGFQLESGHLVGMRQPAPPSCQRELVVSAMRVTAVDSALDAVSGLGDVGEEIQIGLWSRDGAAGDRWEYVAADGTWVADFSVPGDQPWENGLVDIGPGTAFWAIDHDFDGDTTAVYWSVCEPRFELRKDIGSGAGARIWGADWPLGSDVLLTVDDPASPLSPDFSGVGTAVVPPWGEDAGWIHCDPNISGDSFVEHLVPRNLLVHGSLVAATDGTTHKTLTVPDLAVTGVNATADTVTGRATPSASLEVAALQPWFWAASRQTVADAFGDWLVDFSQPLEEAFDVIEGMTFVVIECDADLDCTYQPGPAANQAPVALCQDVTVTAGGLCTADASIDAGSYDPDDDFFTLTQDPPGPYALGITLVGLTAQDEYGATASCSASITVVDLTPPAIAASLDPLGGGDEEDEHAGDDSDEGTFVVAYSATDNCDPNPGCTATLVAPGCGSFATNAAQVIEFEFDDEGCEWESEGGLLEIEGPSLTLEVTCTDAAGNPATAQAAPQGLSADNDSETETDD